MDNKKVPIRVFIVPTKTYALFSQNCNLSHVIRRLNDAQDKFKFIAVLDDGRFRMGVQSSGLEIRRKTPIQNKILPLGNSAEVSNTQKEVVARYIADLDAFAQIETFMKTSPPVAEDDLIIVVDSQVYVPESTDADAELYGYPEADAYSCLGNLVSLGDEDNNKPKQFHGIAIISLARAAILFPEIWEGMSAVNARAKIARYIIMNIAHFLAARSFGQSLAREHMARCVAETNWLGGESVSYSARGICEGCRAEAGRYGPANMYKRFQVRELAAAIDSITSVANKIDKLIEERRIHALMIAFAVVTLALGVFSNLLAGLPIEEDKPYWGIGTYAWQHRPASFLTVIALVVGLGLCFRWLTINRRLP